MFLALGTLCLQTSTSIIVVKLHFHRLPASSTRIQRKMNDIIVSHIMTGIAEISADTSSCPNSKWIIFCQHIWKGRRFGQVAAGACVGKGWNGTRRHQADPQPGKTVLAQGPNAPKKKKASLGQWAAERTRTSRADLQRSHPAACSSRESVTLGVDSLLPSRLGDLRVLLEGE